MGWKRVPKTKVKQLLSKDLPKKLFDELFKNQTLLVNSDKTVKIVSVSQELFNIFEQVKTKAIQPLFLGLGVADTQDFKRARLNLQLASKASVKALPKVVINEKAEQLFLYSRDVWSNSIRSIEGEVKRRGIVFIFNEQGLFLGLAFAMADRLLGKGKKTVLRNIIDIGNYLRIERQ